jgi:hypothetical protein
MSLRLQRAFGLRREEALKLQPRWADRGDHLHLKASWTKGGRERTVPIRTKEQRALLEQSQTAGRHGILDPPGPVLHRAAANLRTPYGERRPVENARPAPCLCPATVPGNHRLALAPCGRPRQRGFNPGATTDRPAGATGYQPRTGPRQRTDHRGLSGALRDAIDLAQIPSPARCPGLPGHGQEPF